jgi:hypothetical protein
MTDETILVMLKANLQIIAGNTLQDAYLQNLIGTAKQMITREGITLADTIEDGNLVVMYAAYLYRKRADDSPVMPRMLRYALNNRLFSQKVSES